MSENKPVSQDRWIVSSHRFCEHPTFDLAEGELARLQAKFPKKNFRIYRCKKRLHQSGNYIAVVEALSELLKSLSDNDQDGLTEFADPVCKARAALARVHGGNQ